MNASPGHRSPHHTILVTGASGRVGGELVAQLATHRYPVRAMTRHPETAASPGGAEVVYGDCDDPGSLDAAFRGVDSAFLMSAQPVGSAAHPTHVLRLVRAAGRAGVRRLVVLSVYDGGTTADALGAWHREAEDAVTGSGMEFTLLRPGRFMSNAVAWAPMLRRGDAAYIPFADRPAAPVDPADIAAVALRALTTDKHRDTAHRLSGPEVLTPAEELSILGEALGRTLRLVEPPIDATEAAMVAAGMSPPVVEAIMARVLTGDDGAEVLPAVAQLLGRPPVTFTRWAAGHTACFTGPTEPTSTGDLP